MSVEIPGQWDETRLGQETEYRETAIKEQVRKIGELLSSIIDSAPSQASEEEKAHVAKATTLLFKLEKWRVWVSKTEYRPEKRNEDTLLRAFRIQLCSPNKDAKSDWIINESVDGDGVKYEPCTFEYDKSKAEGDTYPNEANVEDPSIEDMKMTCKILQESWQLFEEGQHDRILFYKVDQRYRQPKPVEAAES
jgi:hypothetical protein